MAKTCPKCGYTRTAADTGPDYECPSCKIVYAKFEAAQQRAAQTAAQPTARPASSQSRQLNPSRASSDARQLVPAQGAVLGGWVCLAIGTAFMFWTLFSFFFYLPLFLASFVLSIVAIAQRRLGHGIPILLLSIGVPLILGVGLGAYRTQMGLEDLSNQPAAADSRPAPDKKAAPVIPAAYFEVSLRDKEFREANYSAGVQEALTFRVAFRNKTDKDIRAFDGVLGFTDLLDNDVLSAKLSINDPVVAHGELVWNGELDYNQFMDSHRRLKNAAFENLKVWFKPRKILYSNGSTEEIK